MKTRSGFVSNSSSSSFVVIGTRMTDKELKKKGWYDEYEPTDKMPDGLDILHDNDGDIIIGEILASGEDYLDDSKIDLVKLQKTFNRVEKALGVKVKLLIGTRAC